MLITTPKATLDTKLTISWWFGNQYDPVESEPQFLPNKSLAFRRFMWGLRNPMENFLRMVVGFWDQGAHAICPFGGNPNGDWRDDGGMWNFMLVAPATQFLAGRHIFPFLSFRGCIFECYIGWDHGGKAGAAFRRTKATAY